MSDDRVFVKPTTNPGPRLPHDPQQRIPQEGRFVQRTTYITRLLNSGDLVEATAPTPAKKKAAARPARTGEEG